MKRRTKVGDRIRRNPGNQRDNVIPMRRKAPEEDEQSIERDILAALITSTEYINSVKSFWRSDLFPEEWMRLVAKECMAYYNKYGRAPQDDIEPWFEDRLKSDPDRRKTLQVFLQNLRRDYDGSSTNVDYVVDRTKDYIQEQEQLRYGEKYLDLVQRGELGKARMLKPPQTDLGDTLLEVITGSDVKRKSVKWLEPHWLPRGYLTIVAGRKGRGKTLRTLAWVADLSRGLLNDGRTPVGDTLYLSAEDTAEDSIMPRYDVLDGDDHRIHLVQGMATQAEDGERVVDLWSVEYVAKLEQWLDEFPNTALVVIDPVSSFMPEARGGRTSENVHVRRALRGLAKLAGDRGVAIVLTTHLRKGHEGHAVEQIIDSVAYTALSRMIIVMDRDPDDPDNPTKGVIAIADSNLTKERFSSTYRIESVEVDPAVGEQPMLVIGPQSTVTANELLSKPKKPEERLLHEEVQDWAREQLMDGRVRSNTLFASGKEQGYSDDQIRRALTKIGARRDKRGFKNSNWGWRLPKKTR